RIPVMTRPHLTRLAPLILPAVLLSGCVSLDKAAPPVSSFAGHVPASERAVLEKGRDIYVTKCAKCHVPEPVARYSLSHWTKILPEMSHDAKLTASETDSVRAYVVAVL